MKRTGVTARGIISPIFRQGDNVITEVSDAVLRAGEAEGFCVEDGDIVGITESVVARTQGNYATVEQIAADVRAKFGGGDLGIVFPILSRNRFSLLLKGIAQGCNTLTVQLSYPADEVGNPLLSLDMLDQKGVNPYSDSFDEQQFRQLFGNHTVHPFTGIDYIEYYKSVADNVRIVFSNDPAHILQYTSHVLCCDIHSRERSRRAILAKGGKKVLTLAEILQAPVNGSGYNEQYGLLGSNLATENSVKLFPRDCQPVVDGLQAEMKKRTGKTVEVLIYGDGCFKDPAGGIWELADPVVSPAYTSRLDGSPSEIKMKYFADADSELSGLSRDDLSEAMRQRIRDKETSGEANPAALLGTTPRRYPDLIGSLCDLTSGSGDRGTPIVYIKGYFSNFASE